jgi:hypothetical protein
MLREPLKTVTIKNAARATKFFRIKPRRYSRDYILVMISESKKEMLRIGRLFFPQLEPDVDALCSGNSSGYIWDPSDNKRYIGIIHLYRGGLSLDVLIHESMHMALSYLAPRVSKIVSNDGGRAYSMMDLDSHEEELCYTLEWILSSLVRVVNRNYPGSVGWDVPPANGRWLRAAAARPRYPRSWKLAALRY